MNYGARQARGKYLALMIDGAHLVTPRVLAYTKKIVESVPLPLPVVAVRRFYLGPGQQPLTTMNGYTRDVEDELLEFIGWPRRPLSPVRDFGIHGKKRSGWFGKLFESNFLTMPRQLFEAIGGCDERFDIPGGGFLNLDLFARATGSPQAQVFVLFGEGSFHQVHGGTTTNVQPQVEAARVRTYLAQYEAIRGHPYRRPDPELTFFGSADPHCFLV